MVDSVGESGCGKRERVSTSATVSRKQKTATTVGTSVDAVVVVAVMTRTNKREYPAEVTDMRIAYGMKNGVSSARNGTSPVL